ncbi:hypothetical protein MNBD_GAMMA08-1871 [hydrothermal vent metagenome]|uniref:ZipA C-terminal FtsZ-binding domain-containing protein n=1 Tax=hydrothermal vent metagenome TaxID=652676 RepID=A0A3B0X1F6_9ZZZZ
MEMDDLRWILLAVVIVIVGGVFFFTRSRKKDNYTFSASEADDVPSFSAQDAAVNNDWMHGVGPVRVVSDEGSDAVDISEIKESDLSADNTEKNTDKVISNKAVTDSIEKKPTLKENLSDKDLAQENKNQSNQFENKKQKTSEALADEKKPVEEAAIKKTATEASEDKITKAENKPTAEPEKDVAIDDVISVFVLAQKDEMINGEKILSASYALHLDYGEMKIFHRHNQKPDRTIEFSMANVQAPGWFEIDQMNDMQTTGVSFFMQVNLVEKPSSVLDEMLICAHSLSTMLGAVLCNAQRKPLDEASAIELREKVKRLEEIKSHLV